MNNTEALNVIINLTNHVIIILLALYLIESQSSEDVILEFLTLNFYQINHKFFKTCDFGILKKCKTSAFSQK
jgi:hypothetical protein